jgi:hypothetical protein
MRASAIRSSIEKPHDLLIMSWNPTRELPTLHDNPEGAEPSRICLHSQDFLPFRERVRELGVDYLVQSALDEQSLRLFLLHRLHRGPERRVHLRLPLGGNVAVRYGDVEERVKLAELSNTACRVITTQEVLVGNSVRMTLSRGMGVQGELELAGQVIRSAECEAPGGRIQFSTVIRFGQLDESARAELDKVTGGQKIEIPVTQRHSRPKPSNEAQPATPLANHESHAPEAPGEGNSECAAAPPANDQREEARLSYAGRVALIGEGGGLALGRDLSTSGVCIAATQSAAVGNRLTIALYGDPRGEPVLVESTVMRVDAGELALRFDDLNPGQHTAITALLLGPSMVESLGPGAAGGRRVVGQIVA